MMKTVCKSQVSYIQRVYRDLSHPCLSLNALMQALVTGSVKFC